MRRLSVSRVLAGLALVQPACAADPAWPVQTRHFAASCEDLGALCFADACGRDQIDAAQACRARCPSAVILEVVPSACALPERLPVVILRRRG